MLNFIKLLRCLRSLSSNSELAQFLYKESAEDLKAGYTINEDQIFYEMYPYQIETLKK